MNVVALPVDSGYAAHPHGWDLPGVVQHRGHGRRRSC